MRRTIPLALMIAACLTQAAGAHPASIPPEVYSARTAALPQPDFVPRAAPSCPTNTDPAAFESSAALLRDNQAMSDFGRRPTASANQLRFLSWLERRMAAVPGIQLGAVPYDINRWVESGASLRAGASTTTRKRIPISGAVPYAHPARSGVTGQLVYIPPGTTITAHDVKGKIVVRDAVPGSIDHLLLRAVEWAEYDPTGSLLTEIGGKYERDFEGYDARIEDLEDAAKAHAAGLIIVHGFPRAQVKGQYAPYEGKQWEVPALYVGADEGKQLKDLAAHGGVATVALRARVKRSPTRTIVATLPGISSERIIVTSHTDGMNAIWDNGPIAMLGLARYFAALPRECRPRTLQFVFTTAHIYQRLLGGPDRGGTSEQTAKQADKDYDHGGVAMVFAMEHLGAKEYAAVPRTDGGPGRILEPTGRPEMNTMFAGESPILAAALTKEVVAHDLQRTFVLRGADTPAGTGIVIPLQNSFGGEGGAYQQHLIPTIALVAGPWTLYNPAFGMEAVDGTTMRKQSLIFSDLIHELAPLPTAAIGGLYPLERSVRSLICASAFAALGLTRCGSDPYG